VANLDTAISSRLAPAGITNLQADVTAIKTPVTTNLDATISSRLAPAGITSMQADVTAIKTPVVANVDATISSRLASSAYTPTTAMSADVATILSRTDVATSTRVSAGVGGLPLTVTATDTGGSPIDGVAVWITTDVNGANVIAGTLYTGASGQVTFYLSAGVYYAWLQRDGYNLPSPQEVTV
jgi:hypothetical protein